jgi:hypothetical protein
LRRGYIKVRGDFVLKIISVVYAESVLFYSRNTRCLACQVHDDVGMSVPYGVSVSLIITYDSLGLPSHATGVRIPEVPISYPRTSYIKGLTCHSCNASIRINWLSTLGYTLYRTGRIIVVKTRRITLAYPHDRPLISFVVARIVAPCPLPAVVTKQKPQYPPHKKMSRTYSTEGSQERKPIVQLILHIYTSTDSLGMKASIVKHYSVYESGTSFMPP